MNIMNDKNKSCICENCEFREIILSFLNETELQEFCNNKSEKNFRKGDLINKKGDRIDEFKYLKKGLIKIFKQENNGSEQILSITKPFEFVSNLNIFADNYYKYSVTAVEDSVVCIVTLDYLKDLMIRKSDFAIGLMSGLAQAGDNIINQMLDIRQRNLAGRVAYILLYFSKDIYKSKIYELPVSRKEIADYIGMSSANVIRTLTDFRKNGLIRLEGKIIEIADFNKLEIISMIG